MSVIKQTIEDLLKFLEPLLGFANCHMVDFFTHSSYVNFIPKNIQKEIGDIGHDNVINLIFQNNFIDTPSLRNFVESSTNLTLKNCHLCLDFDSFTTMLQKRDCETDKFKLEIFMTAKKSHEVEILAASIASLTKLSDLSHIVDLGDGKGYLSSMLALHNQISVVGVDASDVNTCGAFKRVTKLSKVWNGIPEAPHKSHPKKNENNATPNVNLYKQVTRFVDENFDLVGLVRDIFSFPKDLVPRLGLVGLHTCGDLSPNSLKIFCGNESVKLVCNVGCCYHLLTEGFGNNCGFPLSQFLKDKNLVIGRSARMIANQSVDRVLEAKELPNVTIFYRAILQVLLKFNLKELCNELPDKHVGKFRKRPDNFLEYAKIALKRLEVSAEITDKKIEEVFSRYENRLTELNVFYLLRCKLAPVIETLILLDRLLFLHENGYRDSFLVQFFNPVVSPRCYGIVALKK